MDRAGTDIPDISKASELFAEDAGSARRVLSERGRRGVLCGLAAGGRRE